MDIELNYIPHIRTTVEIMDRLPQETAVGIIYSLII